MASLKMSSTSQLINFDKLVQYLTKYNSRIATLRTLLEAFDKETKDIVEVLKLSTFHTIALEQLCMLMFAKLEILRKEANFIVFGVKSFKYHKSDDPPLFVPNALPMNILTDVMAYSAISSEYLSIQMKYMSQKVQSKNKTAFEIYDLNFDNDCNEMQKIYNQILSKEQEILGFFNSVKVLKDSFSNGKLFLIYLKMMIDNYPLCKCIVKLTFGFVEKHLAMKILYSFVDKSVGKLVSPVNKIGVPIGSESHLKDFFLTNKYKVPYCIKSNKQQSREFWRMFFIDDTGNDLRHGSTLFQHVLTPNCMTADKENINPIHVKQGCSILPQTSNLFADDHANNGKLMILADMSSKSEKLNVKPEKNQIRVNEEKTRSMKRAKIESKSRSKTLDKELSSVLFGAGYRIKYMVGDGNCLFRSLADQLRYNKIIAVTM
jgi:hypothetical protein